MGSPIKINSISIDLADAAKEVKCNHFSIRGYAAKARERDPKESWPFSEESFTLVEQERFSFSAISVPKFRRWSCCSCTEYIDGPKDCGHSNSRTISEMNLDGNSNTDIPSNSLVVVDQEKIAGNVVEENGDVNRERIENDDQTIAQTNAAKKVRPRPKDASNSRTISEMNLDGNNSVIPSKSLAVVDQEKIAVNIVEENGDVNCERIENDDQTIAQRIAQTNAAKKVRPRLKDASKVIPRKSLTVVDQEKIAVNVVEENGDVNSERIEKDDQTIAQTNATKKVRPQPKDASNVIPSKSLAVGNVENVNGERTEKDDHTIAQTIPAKKVRPRLKDASKVIPSKSLAVFDQQKIAGDAVEENGDVNCERIEKDDQTIAQTNAAKKVRPPLKDASKVIPSKSLDHEKIAGNAVEENGDVNGERIEKDDHTIAQTNAAKKVCPRTKDAPKVSSKSRKVASPEKVSKKKPRGKAKKRSLDDQALTTSEDIAGEIEDTPPKAIKKHKGRRRGVKISDNVSSGSVNPSPRKRSGKSRLISKMFVEGNTKTSGDDDGSNIRKEDSASKRDITVRAGRKRKVLPDQSSYVRRRVLRKIDTTTSEKSSKSCDESTDSEIDRDPIKGKKKNRRFQIVDENDADPSKAALSSPVQSNGKDSVPLSTQITEKKKNEKKVSLSKKKVSVSKRKKKMPVTHNKKSKLLSVRAGVDKGKQVKSRTVTPPVNAVSQSTQDLLDEELAADGYFRKSNPRINDKHLQDNDLLKSRDAEANSLREFGSSSKPNTDESLRTGVDVVDFSNNNNTNRSFSPNSPLIRHTSSPTEVADLSSILQKAASGADRNGKTVMVQETHEAMDNTPEEENDEIPMDIVELMARNQYERCLPDKEDDVSNKQPSQETPHKSKNALMIDLNEAYDNEISQEDNNNNNTTRHPMASDDSNARTEEHLPIRKQQPSIDFFPISQPYVAPPSPFGILPPTQENRASSIQWLGNVPTMANQNPSPSPFRVLRGCNTCPSVPHQYTQASHLVWPPPVIQQQCHHHHHHLHTPVSFNMYQSPKPDTFSQASNNGNGWSLNFVAANGGSNSEFSFGCKYTGGRTMERFSSESSIPPFHLHNRMDPRLNSNAHNTDHTMFPRRHFPPVNQAKEFIELQRGDSSKTAYPTNQSLFNFHRPETSRNSFLPSSFSFQTPPQASWRQETPRKDTFPPVNNNSQVFGSSSNEQGRFQLLGASNSMMQPLKSHMTDNEKQQQKKAEEVVKTASTLPQKKSSELPVCNLNRNPADFTIPEAGNVYMLTGETLKGRKRAVTYKRRQCKQDALKQTKKPVRSATENA